MSPSAIVTGASRGIGRAIAVALAREGFDVGITWNSSRDGAFETAEEVEEAGRRAVVCQMDLTCLPGSTAAIEAVAEQLGGLDVLVNNAGQGRSHSFLDYPLEDWHAVIDVNLTGAFLCAQRAARLMIAAGTQGRIINITSVHEHIPLKEAAAYCAAKGGLGLLTKVMALELAEHGIRVNSVAPGEIATAMTGNEDVDPDEVERPAIPEGRPGNAHEVAALVAWLASPDARYATGSSFVVDGGLMLMAAQANA